MTLKPDNKHGGDISAIAQKLGLIDVPDVKLDFSVNINPLGPPDCIMPILSAGNGIQQYPEIYADNAASALADAHGVNDECVFVGNGSTEIMSWILQSLKPDKPAWMPPCYAGYQEICDASSLNGVEINAMTDFQDSEADLLFLDSPNNPTGTILDPDEIISLAQNNTSKWIVIDESFMDFVEDSSSRTLIREDIPENLIVIKSLTKFFAIPGLRLGMGYAHSNTIGRIKKARLPWSVNALAQQAAIKLYSDQSYLNKSRATVTELRGYLTDKLNQLEGWTITPSSTNYVLVKLPNTTSASELQADLLKKSILIRSCANFSGLGEQYVRLAVRPKNEVDDLIAAINHPAATEAKADKQPLTINHPTSIMLVGTMSDAGKTVLAAGLCRCFQRKGIKVAPFKAQNMSLNSFVTEEGGEMGRAQVVQAEAACIKPHTDMNPVLLKPTGDTGSQVIVDGEPIGNFPAKEYYEMKDRMKQAAHAAYDRLAQKYDMIVLEGAGSPTEINLMAEDFVNMSMAEYAQADVILVADIDRGGVFASIYGTIKLLPEKYRKLIKGVIINKFRGDESLLDSGIQQIEELTGVPVLGILPYIRNLNIEDEDSLGLEKRTLTKNALVDIAVIRFSRISNYTDFLSLENTNDVSVRYVSKTQELGRPDLVILPGTKNTRADLNCIQEEGLTDAIMDLARDNIPVFGICGGYQMLGSRISDPSGIEGTAGEDIGMNLLPLNTVLVPRKELAQVEGHIEQPLPFAKPQTPFSGYEIHAGRTSSAVYVNQPLLITQRASKETSESAGSISENGLIFGCYIHGIFDSKPLREQLLNWLCERKNIKPPQWQTSKANEFDELADLIESRINLP